MRNRFGGKKSSGILKSILLPVLFFAAVLIFFYISLQNMTGSVQSEQLKATERAVRRSTVHCYAIEGQYPPSLQYLEEHYGLSIDRSRYVVHYQPIAANLMPEITVFPISELNESSASSGADPFEADGFTQPGLQIPDAPPPAPDAAPLPGEDLPASTALPPVPEDMLPEPIIQAPNALEPTPIIPPTPNPAAGSSPETVIIDDDNAI